MKSLIFILSFISTLSFANNLKCSEFLLKVMREDYQSDTLIKEYDGDISNVIYYKGNDQLDHLVPVELSLDETELRYISAIQYYYDFTADQSSLYIESISNADKLEASAKKQIHKALFREMISLNSDVDFVRVRLSEEDKTIMLHQLVYEMDQLINANPNHNVITDIELKFAAYYADEFKAFDDEKKSEVVKRILQKLPVFEALYHSGMRKFLDLEIVEPLNYQTAHLEFELSIGKGKIWKDILN